MTKHYLRILRIDWVEPHHQRRLMDTVHEVFELGDNSVTIHWPDCLPMMEPIMRVCLKHGMPPHLALCWEDGDRWELVEHPNPAGQ